MMDTNLGERMVARANSDHLPADHEMRILAEKFDQAARDFFGNPQKIGPKQFIGHFARARRCWCDYTGEPLV